MKAPLVLIFISCFTLFQEIFGGPSNRIYWLSQPCKQNCPTPINYTGIIPSGFDSNYPTMEFLVRVRDDGNMLSGKAIQANHRIYVPKGGHEVSFDHNNWHKADLLVFPQGVLHWIPAEGSKVPLTDMVPVGILKQSKEILYACRIYADKNVISGKYQESVGECVVPYDQHHTECLVFDPLISWGTVGEYACRVTMVLKDMAGEYACQEGIFVDMQINRVLVTRKPIAESKAVLSPYGKMVGAVIPQVGK